MSELVIRHSGDVTRCGPFTLSKCGMEVNGSPSFDQWQECGSFLQRAAGAVQWWVGDWLNYGEKKYGETYAQAIELTGLDYHTIRTARYISSVFESDRRRSLSFSHHSEVASLPSVQADAMLARAEEEGWSTRELRQHVKQLKNGEVIGVETDSKKIRRLVVWFQSRICVPPNALDFDATN